MAISCITSQNVLTLRYMYEDNLLLPKCGSHFLTDRRKLCPCNINNSWGSFVTSKFMIIFINLIVRLSQMFILFFCQTCLPLKVRNAEINRIHFYCTTESVLTHLMHSHVTFCVCINVKSGIKVNIVSMVTQTQMQRMGFDI